MHMHVTPYDGPIQKVLIRKEIFVAQCRWKAERRAAEA
jgi:hypothetical protein